MCIFKQNNTNKVNGLKPNNANMSGYSYLDDVGRKNILDDMAIVNRKLIHQISIMNNFPNEKLEKNERYIMTYLMVSEFFLHALKTDSIHEQERWFKSINQVWSNMLKEVKVKRKCEEYDECDE